MWLSLWLLLAPRVFVSYPWADRPAAAAIAGELGRAGCRVWFDDVEIRTGEPYAEPIETAIDGADVVVAVIGTPCRTCRNEQARAARQLQRVVVILLSPAAAAHVPLFLEPYPIWSLEQFHEHKLELCAPNPWPRRKQ